MMLAELERLAVEHPQLRLACRTLERLAREYAAAHGHDALTRSREALFAAAEDFGAIFRQVTRQRGVR